MKTLLRFVLCLPLLSSVARADHLEDLRRWHLDGLPVTCVWNFDGFPLEWHLEQVNAGRRMIPSVHMSAASNVEQVRRRIDGHLPAYKWIADNGLPISLRGDFSNLSGLFLPKAPGVVRGVPADAPWVYGKVEGGYQARGMIDVFGPTSNWARLGKSLASQPLMTRLQQVIPNPSMILFCDNNEGPEDAVWPYVITRPVEGRSYPFRRWRTQEELATMSERMRARVAELGQDSDPYDFLPEFSALQTAQYRALFEAFRDALSPGWKSKVWTVAYKADVDKKFPPQIVEQIGIAPVVRRYDGPSSQMYLKPFIGDLTSSSHLAINANLAPLAKAYESKVADIFVNLNPNAAAAGAERGNHDVIDPTMWQAYLEWQMWLSRTPGLPLVMHYWCGSASRPADLFFRNTARLNAINRGDLAETTEGDYAIATARACDRICETPLLREFWLKGTPVKISYPAESSPYRVAATQLEDRCLVCVFTPHRDFAGPASVEVPGFGKVSPPGSGYWIVKRRSPAAGDHVIEPVK